MHKLHKLLNEQAADIRESVRLSRSWLYWFLCLVGFGKKINKINWCEISRSYQLDEKFIREFRRYVVWEYISKYQTLSEDFIREFKSRVHWQNISIYQNISEGFIKEFENYVDWNAVSIFQAPKFPKGFIDNFEHKIDKSRIYMTKEWIDLMRLLNHHQTFLSGFKNQRETIAGLDS